ncbi:MAG: hypothetical protein Q8K82_25520 [Gemmatimonadaceae bacterium]|nr:hypothetical protein [Gemmatimonadaceae bacterium]
MARFADEGVDVRWPGVRLQHFTRAFTIGLLPCPRHRIDDTAPGVISHYRKGVAAGRDDDRAELHRRCPRFRPNARSPYSQHGADSSTTAWLKWATRTVQVR